VNRNGLLLLPIALALSSCGKGAAGSTGAEPVASGSAAPRASAPPVSSGPVVPAKATSVPVDPPAPAAMPASFVGAKSEKACKATTFEVATYQKRGDIALAGHANGIAAIWRTKLAGKAAEQIAFASFDKEGRPAGRPRGVGQTGQDVAPRVFASGTEWTVIWFDDTGLAYMRPRIDPLPPPVIAHVPAIGPSVASDVALSASPANAVLAAAPFGADKAQLGIFLFAPADESAPSVKALGVGHHGKQPHRPAIAASEKGIYVAWDEGGSILGSRFDAAGKEGDAACTIAPAGPQREGFSLAATASGAVAMWMEGGKVKTRALDASGCPSSPIWTVAEGRWASLAPLGDTAIVAWSPPDGKLLAVRLQANGAPAEKGIEAGEGSSGVKDAPVVIALEGGKAVFGWSEAMSAVISTKRLMARIVDAACIP
jgi:hypothetical protein